MNKRLFLVLVLMSAMLGECFAQRVVENINRDWDFNYGWDLVSLRQRGSEINLPHTWNLDALSGQKEYYRGLGNYTKQINIPREWKSTKQIYIHFDAVGQSAELFVNGRRVGQHDGGYTAFSFNITSFLNFGSKNTIWVRASNAHNMDVMPLVSNFNIYGGIYRNVELIVVPNAHISNSRYATSGVQITTRSIEEQKASVDINALIEGTVGSSIDVEFILRNGTGEKIDSIQKKVKIGMNGTGTVQWGALIHSPRLWNGTIDPHQYSVDVMVLGDIKGKSTSIKQDSIREYFGLRSYEVNANNEFILNGTKYPLRGVVRYGDNPLRGSAIYTTDNELDIALIKEMGANAVRVTPMASNREFIEMCDKEGIIVWSEIPFTGPGKYRDTGYNNSEEFKENGEEQLNELLAQQYNNPSVMFIGLFNEIAQRGDDPTFYIKTLNNIVKETDNTKLTVGASNQDGEINFITDLIGFNLYLGWDEGAPEDIANWSKSVRSQWPNLKVGLSEYGAGGSIQQHEAPKLRPEAQGKWHPEEWQTKLHHEYLKAIESSNAFWGTFACALSDWGTAYLNVGDRCGVNDMGLVTFDRVNKKDAFYLYKANWNENESFVHITSKRDKIRKGVMQDITVFSPSDSVELIVNDVAVEKIAGDNISTFVFKKCSMRVGENKIVARNEEGDEDIVFISIIK